MTPVKYNVPFVFHFRNVQQDKKNCENFPTIASRGGLTVVFDPSNKHFGIARCSNKDNYNRKLGAKIALGRAGNSDDKEDWVLEDGHHHLLNVVVKDDEFFVENIRQKAQEIASQFGY